MSNENHVADLADKKANEDLRCEECEEVGDDFTAVWITDTRTTLWVCPHCLDKGFYNNIYTGRL